MAVYLSYLLQAALIGVAVFLLIVVFQRWRGALSSRGKITFLEEQLARALDQIHSDDEDEILAGFQTITQLNDTRSRLKALGRVHRLTGDRNALIARQAQRTYLKLVSELEKAASGSPRS